MSRRSVFAPRPARAFAAPALVVAALGLSGCAEMSPQTTTLQYDPADGVSAKVGPVGLQDVLIVSSEDGKTTQLSGLATNKSSKPVKMTVGTSAKGGTPFTVPARASVRLDGKPSGNSAATIPAVKVSGVGSKPGESATLAFTSTAAGQVEVVAPVLLDQHPYGSATVTHPHAEGGEEGGH